MINKKLLEKTIKESGIKKAFIAKELGIDPSILSKKISGKRQFNIEEALKLCDCLDIKNPCDIFFYSKSDIIDK